jgi:3',5'-cyclic AMP phosphodiesterase CpdA
VKITAISDTHGKHAELNLTGGDLLIHAGDISNRGLVHEVNDFLHWFSNQNYTHKIFIAGNHDFLFERNAPLAQSMIPDNIIYLNDSECDVDGVKF